MKLTFHIFWKDARYLWREVTVSLALLVARGWSVPREWTDAGPSHFAAADWSTWSSIYLHGMFWDGLLVVLLPVSWLFAVVRAIQSDSLVGDRQFWLTRPYDRKQLFAAKCLFILAFINLPLLILDLYLLAKAGFAPMHYMVGLLWIQCLITLILVIPIAALATVTATVVQLLLTLLVIVLYMVGSSFLSERMPASAITSTGPLPTILLLATPLGMIALQYARRRTMLARSLILLPMIGLVLITVLAPYRRLISRQYPALRAGEQPPIQLALGENLGTWRGTRKLDAEGAGIVLPLVITRTDPDSILIMKGSHVVVEGPDGLHWDAGWAPMNSMQILPGQNYASVNFALPMELYRQLRPTDVKIQVTLAFTYFQDANRRKFVVPEGTFALPEVGLCSASLDDPARTYRRPQPLMCLAPFHQPTSLYMKLKLNESTCPLPEGTPALPDDALGFSWVQSSESPAEFGIDPVVQFALAPFGYSNVSFPHDQASSDHPHPPASKDRPHVSVKVLLAGFENSAPILHGICPGTPLTLSNPQRARDMQMTQQFEKVHLPDEARFPSATGSLAK
jgi:hypothetical protein